MRETDLETFSQYWLKRYVLYTVIFPSCLRIQSQPVNWLKSHWQLIPLMSQAFDFSSLQNPLLTQICFLSNMSTIKHPTPIYFNHCGVENHFPASDMLAGKHKFFPYRSYKERVKARGSAEARPFFRAFGMHMFFRSPWCHWEFCRCRFARLWMKGFISEHWTLWWSSISFLLFTP